MLITVSPKTVSPLRVMSGLSRYFGLGRRVLCDGLGNKQRTTCNPMLVSKVFMSLGEVRLLKGFGKVRKVRQAERC